MGTTTAIAMLSVGAFGVTVATAAPSEAQAVQDALHAACEAFRVGDVEGVTASLDDRFTLTDSSGAVTTRADAIAEVRAREPRYEVFRNHSMKVRLYGSTAVVNGITSLQGTAGGKPFAAELQFTDTLIKRAGRWVLVASHVSPAPRSAPAP